MAPGDSAARTVMQANHICIRVEDEQQQDEQAQVGKLAPALRRRSSHHRTHEQGPTAEPAQVPHSSITAVLWGHSTGAARACMV